VAQTNKFQLVRDPEGDDKVPQDKVEYGNGSKDRVCANCLFFIPPASCEIVQGPVRADGVSLLWRPDDPEIRKIREKIGL